MESAATRKRPIGVWIITVYFAITIPFVMFGIYAVLSNSVPIDPAQAAYFASLPPSITS